MIENLQSIINQKKSQMGFSEVQTSSTPDNDDVLKLIFQYIQQTSKQEFEILTAIMDNQKIIVEKLNELGK